MRRVLIVAGLLVWGMVLITRSGLYVVRIIRENRVVVEPDITTVAGQQLDDYRKLGVTWEKK